MNTSKRPFRSSLAAFFVLSLGLSACGPGEEGPQGPQGPAGQQGPAGPKGDAGGLAGGRYCIGNAVAGSGVNVIFEHTAYDFSDGSVMAVCSVSWATSQSSNMFIWAADTVGADEGYCSTTFDVAGSGSFGRWAFVGAETGVVVEYADPGSGYDGQSFTLTRCNTF